MNNENIPQADYDTAGPGLAIGDMNSISEACDRFFEKRGMTKTLHWQKRKNRDDDKNRKNKDQPGK